MTAKEGVALFSPTRNEAAGGDVRSPALSNADITEALYIGETTVKTHASRLLSKLQLASRWSWPTNQVSSSLAVEPGVARSCALQ